MTVFEPPRWPTKYFAAKRRRCLRAQPRGGGDSHESENSPTPAFANDTVSMTNNPIWRPATPSPPRCLSLFVFRWFFTFALLGTHADFSPLFCFFNATAFSNHHAQSSTSPFNVIIIVARIIIIGRIFSLRLRAGEGAFISKSSSAYLICQIYIWSAGIVIKFRADNICW